MGDINKDLVPYTQELEEHFSTQAPMLFGCDFMKMATEHWNQLKDLRKMRDKPNSLGFQKSWFNPGKWKMTALRRAPYNTRPAIAEMTKPQK